MADTFVKIATVTVGAGGAANIDFTSIPATYTDLSIKISARSNRVDTGDHLNIGFNGSTSSFTVRALYGTGTTTSSFTSIPRSIGQMDATGSTANVFTSYDVYLPNYAGSNYKSYSADSAQEENGATGNFLQLTAGLWSNTSAINQVTLSPNVGTGFLQYSTATLYGIKNS